MSSGSATMRNTIDMVHSDVGCQAADGRPMSEGSLETTNRPPASPTTDPNNPLQGPAGVRLPPDLSLPPRSRGHNRFQGRPRHLKHQRVVLGSLRQIRLTPYRKGTVRCQMTLPWNQIRLLGDPLSRAQVIHTDRWSSSTSPETVSFYVHKGTAQKDPLTEQEFNTGWKLIMEPSILCSMVSLEVISSS